jgi:flagellar biosynthesis/type III secretory pathway chaperone
MAPEERMADLVNVTTRLINVLERENEMLRERRHGELPELLEEKETIGRVYQARISGLHDNPDQLRELAELEREELRELATEVENLIQENGRMLQAAMYASNRIMELVANSVRESSNSSGIYSERGSTTLPVRKGTKQGGAISFDQTL